ncbi:MAG: hypothetical protein ACLGHQ_16265, partial [Acidimicrobiia bacterium]
MSRPLPGCRAERRSSVLGWKPLTRTAFTDDGTLADERLPGRFDDTIDAFLDLVEASKHYPCIKRAWVEFIGEHRWRCLLG